MADICVPFINDMHGVSPAWFEQYANLPLLPWSSMTVLIKLN